MIEIKLHITESEGEPSAKVTFNVSEFSEKEIRYLEAHLEELKGPENAFYRSALRIIEENKLKEKRLLDMHGDD